MFRSGFDINCYKTLTLLALKYCLSSLHRCADGMFVLFRTRQINTHAVVTVVWQRVGEVQPQASSFFSLTKKIRSNHANTVHDDFTSHLDIHALRLFAVNLQTSTQPWSCELSSEKGKAYSIPFGKKRLIYDKRTQVLRSMTIIR